MDRLSIKFHGIIFGLAVFAVIAAVVAQRSKPPQPALERIQRQETIIVARKTMQSAASLPPPRQLDRHQHSRSAFDPKNCGVRIAPDVLPEHAILMR